MPTGHKLTFGKAHGLEPGNIIRQKAPKNRSPYFVIAQTPNDNEAIGYNMDDPENGNRRARRARFAERKKSK